ncbi:hypothetical protein AUEXF2481DRAFT_533988 [Aureobasidium subglaciale EXF-2481]|uniref:Uncharacterized protein n=1 Tax=Aureobasidium subglaciale (strain EXF-2481) TaxID=1043005 RepID=A0A074XZ16_AURSE|nr:uncharacterized protein AUEXF2481DRAFT_533988 [Aureobasidium subglaciale EXF-2481]KEQ90675.1 hypothetical protein AUEXF2481DRAFT_533988 [Aureobasidium subglaciale EXF-2481]
MMPGSGFGSTTSGNSSFVPDVSSWSKQEHQSTVIREHHFIIGFDGLLENGELLLVLGRPQEAAALPCLRAHKIKFNGLTLEKQSKMQYKGMSFEDMQKFYPGQKWSIPLRSTNTCLILLGEMLEFVTFVRAPHAQVW